MTDDAPQRWDTGRVEAFSDGVFAIAITYVTSFLTVGSLWIAHHALFKRLRYVDPVLLRINLLLLLVAAFLPFPTGVLAEAVPVRRHPRRPDRRRRGSLQRARAHARLRCASRNAFSTA